MTDYISRDWLLDVVENIIKWDTERDRNRIIHQVRELTPPADVRPVCWIPVSERLPDMNDYDWVLGVVSGKFGYTVFQNAVICVGYDPDFGFFLEEYPDVEITVSHWMPLPEPPKEEENVTDD